MNPDSKFQQLCVIAPVLMLAFAFSQMVTHVPRAVVRRSMNKRKPHKGESEKSKQIDNLYTN